MASQLETPPPLCPERHSVIYFELNAVTAPRTARRTATCRWAERHGHVQIAAALNPTLSLGYPPTNVEKRRETEPPAVADRGEMRILCDTEKEKGTSPFSRFPFR